MLAIGSLLQFEFQLHRRSIQILLLLPLFLFVVNGDLSAYILAICIIPFYAIMTSCAYDEFFKLQNLMGSLPVTRFHIVSARYLFGFIVLLVSLGYVLICGTVVRYTGIQSGIPQVSISLLVMLAAIGSLGITFSLPFFYKFGFIRGKLLRMLLMAVTVPIILLLGKGLESFLSRGIEFMPIIVIVSSISITVISYLLSLRIFKHKDIV